MEQLFEQWRSSKNVGKEYEKLRQLIVIEELEICIRDDIKPY